MDEDLRQELDELRAEMRHLAHHVKKISKLKKDQTQAIAEDYLEDAHSKMNEHLDKMTDKAKETGDELDRYVRENPWQVVGVAAAAGLFLGLLFSVRKRD